MATREPKAIRALARAWTSGIKSAKFAGICGDAAHRARGGYHISREDQPRSNYSVTHHLDKLGAPNLASALDIDMSRADMILVSKRLRAAILRRDSRIVGKVNAFNGTLDGRNARRFNADGRVESASADHVWHVHLEVHRKYANDLSVCRGIAEVVLAKKLTAVRKKVGGVLATVFTAVVVALVPHHSAPAPKPVPAPAPTFTTPALPAPKPVKPAPVRKPAPPYKAPSVKQIQARVHVKQDGKYGPRTLAAVKAFQRAHHLTVTGKVDRKTAAAMRL